MSRMKDLFGDTPYEPGEAYARSTDPGTSHAAARSVEPEATRLEYLVKSAIGRASLGLTCDEVCSVTGLNWNTVSPRLAPLLRKKLIWTKADLDGRPMTRVGKSGRQQRIYFSK